MYSNTLQQCFQQDHASIRDELAFIELNSTPYKATVEPLSSMLNDKDKPRPNRSNPSPSAPSQTPE